MLGPSGPRRRIGADEPRLRDGSGLRLLTRGILLLAALGFCGCVDAEAEAEAEDPENARSTALHPVWPDAYYTEQASKYFDALDESADPSSLPTYSELAARWEWPPWLLLTGFGGKDMASLDRKVKSLTPATIPERDCRASSVQPFARCRVTFVYAGGPCPIYEEFTFNDQGEISFIEAWSDLPEMRPMDERADPWAEAADVHRLSTRIPGLGNKTGRIDLDSEGMRKAAEADPEIADFVARARDFWGAWFEAYKAAGDDFFARGCGW